LSTDLPPFQKRISEGNFFKLTKVLAFYLGNLTDDSMNYLKKISIHSLLTVPAKYYKSMHDRNTVLHLMLPVMPKRSGM
jgi:hypothetical protein